MEKYPNWLEMPDELMTKILQRLSVVERLTSAQKVCRTWRKICTDPAMFKVIVIFKWFHDRDGNYDLEALTKQAVDLSCGELTHISIEGFGSGDLLDYIVLRSRKLNRLGFCTGCNITGSQLAWAVKSVPELEILRLSSISINGEDIEVIGRNCPQLKSFKLFKEPGGVLINCDDHALAIANNMPGLRCLELTDEEMTNNGFQAILNGCPHLKVLDVRFCRNLKLCGYLVKLCTERIKDFKHTSTQKLRGSKFSVVRPARLLRRQNL